MSKVRRMFYEAFAKAGGANATSSLDKPLIKDVLSIDFETANIGRDACSLGVVHMKNDEIVFKKNFLIDPEAYFQSETIQVHGITPQMVAGAPTFPEIVEELRKLITPDTLVVAHNAKFDLDVLKKNALRYELTPPDVNFLCSLKLSDAFFPTIPSCNLKNLARTLGFELDHHNSLSDAEVALQVLQHIMGALRANGKTLESYMEQRGMEFGRLEDGVLKHFSSKASKAYRLPFPKDEEAFAFSGKSFVFAGHFTYWNKNQCEQMVIERDGVIKNRMSNLVDYFVVGSPGFFVLQEDFDERIAKAKLLEVNGGRMKVITEEEWVEMMSTVLEEGKLN